MKYNTVEELQAAFANGELDKTQDYLVIDNDHCTCYKISGEGGFEDPDQVFSIHPADLMEKLLDLAEIPHVGA